MLEPTTHAGQAPALESLARWRAAWPEALALWSKYTRLRDPRLCQSQVEAAREGLTGSFAMIRLFDQSVVVDLHATQRLGLDDYAVEILAHEIGHHVLAPGSASEHFRLLARIRRGLPTLEAHAPMLANLYTDLLINDRLQRQAGLRMAAIYQAIDAPLGAPKSGPKQGVWMLYMGIYEQLWQLPKGSLGGPQDDPQTATDAWLGARLIRVYANDWLSAAAKFASLFLPYLLEDTESQQTLAYWHDTQTAAQGCAPSGGQIIEADELEEARHPCEDPHITGRDEAASEAPSAAPVRQSMTGQTREPFEYGEILKACGVQLSDHQLAVRYYRERALPFLLPFPQSWQPDSPQPQVEGLQTWDIGEPFEHIDWLHTLMQSTTVIPGVTTVQRLYGSEPGRAQQRVPIDLDLYVDSSGSMPNPQTHTSFLTLAGAIIALSALRAGSRVQVTLWSGKNQEQHTDGFVRHDESVLRVLTGFYGGATCFPIHRLRETFSRRTATDRPVHILMISDDGISTLFDQDERGTSGWQVAAEALAKGRAGGTMALNIPADWSAQGRAWPDFSALRRARDEQHWAIHAIDKLDDLVAFAREFSRRHYSREHAPSVHQADRFL
jgi:hypothetical protein